MTIETRSADIRRWGPLLWLALAMTGMTGAAPGCTVPGEAPSQAADAPEVDLAVARQQDIPARFEFIGTVEAVQRVELRARVRGYITAVNFEEGALLEANQVLYEIDTRPLRAEQRSAAATVKQIQARLDEAHRQLNREKQLRAANVNAIADLDRAQAEVDALEAELNAQRATLTQANLDIGYSKIRAPFSGRVGERLVDVGELVGDADSTLLAVVVQEHPVFVRFAPAERERRQMLQRLPNLETPEGAASVPVDITVSDGGRHEEKAKLTFIDNVFDPSTRSIVYKAVVDNEKRGLKPGESVTVGIDLPASPRVVVPMVAVASVQDVDYVYVVDAEGTAHYREVRLGRTIDDQRVVESGVEPGERVIVHGIQRVEDGKKVAVRAAKDATKG